MICLLVCYQIFCRFLGKFSKYLFVFSVYIYSILVLPNTIFSSTIQSLTLSLTHGTLKKKKYLTNFSTASLFPLSFPLSFIFFFSYISLPKSAIFSFSFVTLFCWSFWCCRSGWGKIFGERGRESIIYFFSFFFFFFFF